MEHSPHQSSCPTQEMVVDKEVLVKATAQEHMFTKGLQPNDWTINASLPYTLPLHQ